MRPLRPLVFLVVATLPACGNRAADVRYNLPAALTPPTGAVQVIDARPADSKTWRGPSLTDLSPRWVYGDDQFSPDRLTVLRQKLERHFLDAGGSHAVTIVRFEVVNSFAKNEADAWGAKSPFLTNPAPIYGPVGVAVAAGLEQLLKPDDEPQNRIICNIQGTIDGRPFAASAAQSYLSDDRSINDNAAVRSTVPLVIDACTEMAARQAAAASG